MQLDGWNRRFERGDNDIPQFYYDRPELDVITKYYLAAWLDLVTERPVISSMSGATVCDIPRSKIKSYAEDDLGLVGEEVEFLIAVIRRVEARSVSKISPDKDMTDQVAGGDAAGVKTILGRLGSKKQRPDQTPKKPRVRHPRP